MGFRRFPLFSAGMAVVAALALTVGATAAPRHVAPHSVKKRVVPAPKKDGGPIGAPHVILIDGQNGSVLFERSADTLIPPASLAKLMTVEYVFHLIKEGKLRLTDEFPVSENAWRKGGAPSHTSTMFAALNSSVSVDDLLHGIIIQSANDACIVLAEGIAGSEAKFAEQLDQARARDRLDEIDLRQFQRAARSGHHGDVARTGDAGLLHHPSLSGFL